MSNNNRAQLPIDPYLEPIRSAWSEKKSLIVKAAPGSGKTTRVPAFLADAGEKQVIVLEPRRLAARLSAEWVASEHGSAVGGFAGYQVRFERRWGEGTKVLFVTEGIFLNLLVSDPTLSSVGTVIIDEFHERHINTDIALAVVKKMQESSRPDLKLMIMSATIDTNALEAYLGSSAVFDIPGRTFTVTTSFHPGETERPSAEHLAGVACRMLKDESCPGNILVFATGMREIRDVTSALKNKIGGTGIDVFSLSADTSKDDQNKIFATAGRRRIVVSTNVAETSVTIPGITGVVDNGLAKISGYAEWSGMSTLDVRKVSKASCIQRSGRAGRTAPGVCYRAFSESDFLGRQEYTVPEIQRTDLAELLLTLAAAGIVQQCDQSVTIDLNWFEAPHPQHLEAATNFLTVIGAIDKDHRLTVFGRRIAALPLSPRLAATLVRGIEEGIGDLAAAAVAVIGESGIHRFNAAPPVAHDCDIEFQSECLLKILANQELAHAERAYIDSGKARSAGRVWSQLTKKSSPTKPQVLDADVKALKRALLGGFPDRVAQKKSGQQRNFDTYSFCGGGGGVLSRASVLKGVDLLIAVDSTLTHARSGDVGVSIEIASGISKDDLVGVAPEMRHQNKSARWNDKVGRAEILETDCYGGIVLTERVSNPQTDDDKEKCSQLLAAYLKANWTDFCAGNDFLFQYLLRSALLNKHNAAGFPEFEGDMLELFIDVICEGRWSLASLAGPEMKGLIYEQLTWDQTQLLEKLTPEYVVLSGSRKFPVTYRSDAPPMISGYIQDYFGTPGDIAILNGKLVVAVELIGPNKRPLQITSSLAGFWQQTYHQLKPELSRNYPRHYWPDQPESALPVLLKSRLPKT